MVGYNKTSELKSKLSKQVSPQSTSTSQSQLSHFQSESQPTLVAVNDHKLRTHRTLHNFLVDRRTHLQSTQVNTHTNDFMLRLNQEGPNPLKCVNRYN